MAEEISDPKQEIIETKEKIKPQTALSTVRKPTSSVGLSTITLSAVGPLHTSKISHSLTGGGGMAGRCFVTHGTNAIAM